MMYILKVPVGTDITTASEELQAAIRFVNGQYPESIMYGTEPVGGFQLVLIYANANKAEIEALIESFGLDWFIVAAQGEQVNQSLLLPFFSEVVTIDASGNESSEPVTDLTGKLQVFSGHNWVY
jgi:hypothetical protein